VSKQRGTFANLANKKASKLTVNNCYIVVFYNIYWLSWLEKIGVSSGKIWKLFYKVERMKFVGYCCPINHSLCCVNNANELLAGHLPIGEST
jgi:hypothetical protein